MLRATGALQRILPELDDLNSDDARRDTLHSLDRAARRDDSLEVRFAVLLHRIGGAAGGTSDREPLHRSTGLVEDVCRRLGVPRAVRDLAMLVRRDRDPLLAALAVPWSVATLEEVMERGDAFRRGPRFVQAIEAIACTFADDGARASFVASATQAFDAARTIDAGAIARAMPHDPRSIAVHLRAAREAAIAGVAS